MLPESKSTNLNGMELDSQTHEARSFYKSVILIYLTQKSVTKLVGCQLYRAFPLFQCSLVIAIELNVLKIPDVFVRNKATKNRRRHLCWCFYFYRANEHAKSYSIFIYFIQKKICLNNS
jgi:hypothetical protein